MDWWTWVLPLVVVVILLMMLMTLAMWRAVRGQSDGPARMDLVDPALAREAMSDAAEVFAWAESHGFEWIGLYELTIPANPRIWMALWGQIGKGLDPTYRYLVQASVSTSQRTRKAVEFVDGYDQDRSLSTTDSRAEFLYPGRKGLFKQAFPGTPIAALFERHQAAAELLARTANTRPEKDARPVDEKILESMGKTAKRVRAIPFWPLVLLWRLFTLRLYHNRTIEQQWGGRLGPMS